MTSLLELLRSYPILESLVVVLPLGDLFNLSKTNSAIRAALHGFSAGFLEKPYLLKAVRPVLCIGRHTTSHWRNLKAKSPLCCSELQHTRGDKVKGCLVCSMPVCEACIIKASFGKRDENTFQNRTCSLCGDCFSSGNSHQETLLNGEENAAQTPYFMRTECICTAKDGHLCLRCKTKQNSKVDSKTNRCYGIGCSESILDGFGGRVCLWCDSPLPRERSRAQSRRDYDARHLLARSHSSYDQIPDEGFEDDIIDSAEHDAIGASSFITPTASKRTPSPKKTKVVAYDSFEDARKRELETVSERRQFTASTEEEQRWRRSETLRRSESGCCAPPPRRPGPALSFAAPISIGTHFRSTSLNLIPEDDSSLPSYESCTHQDPEETRTNLLSDRASQSLFNLKYR